MAISDIEQTPLAIGSARTSRVLIIIARRCTPPGMMDRKEKWQKSDGAGHVSSSAIVEIAIQISQAADWR